MPASDYLELLDWRRRVADLFAELRRRPDNTSTLAWFRSEKDVLFRDHPQSPIPSSEREDFRGLNYWLYDADARVTAHFTEDEQAEESDDEGELEHSDKAPSDGVAFRRIGTLAFTYHHHALRLPAFWIEGYAGGLFVPFRDSTSGRLTYGGGRYLLDTIKSGDLGSNAAAGTVVLDFNYAYHPSCTYDPRWVCPLAPPDSRLAIAVEAGERLG